MAGRLKNRKERAIVFAEGRLTCFKRPLFYILFFSLFISPVFSQETITNSDCLSCHPDQEKFAYSVHRDNDCTSCHSDITEIPHPEKLGKVDCSPCHGDIFDIFRASSHGKAMEKNRKEAPDCVKCHGNHEILPKTDPKSKTHPLNQVEICYSCHKGMEVDQYKNTVHGRGLLRSGLLVSPSCVTCHTAHNVRNHKDPQSTVYFSRIPELCGSCHLGILEDYQISEHGKQWARGLSTGPGCVTCHGAHGILDPVATEFQLNIPLVCARCHEREAPTYQDSFHGQAVSLGFVRSATCSDCHTPHKNLGPEHPDSTVAPAHLQNTCGKCHGPVSSNFVTFQPHANPKDPSRNRLFYYIYNAMVILLISVFGFWGIHTILWLQRAIVAYRRKELVRYQETEGPWIQRFPVKVRVIHIFIMFSFLGLAFTGLPLRFHYAQWTKTLIGYLGGLEISRFFHRFFAAVTFGYAFYHLAEVFHRLVIKKEYGLLYGASSLVPRLKDFQDLFGMIRWFLYLGKIPRFDRWTYWEKFDYFAVFWGVPVIGISGLLLWFPGFFTNFIPGYILNIAMIIHGEEALLAVGFIFTFHFFHTHLRPESFPMDLVIFTGRMPLERFRHERPEEYDRLVATGQLESYLVDPPTKKQKRTAYAIGITGLVVGLTLILLILLSIVFL